jgi:hypothetical protein
MKKLILTIIIILIYISCSKENNDLSPKILGNWYNSIDEIEYRFDQKWTIINYALNRTIEGDYNLKGNVLSLAYLDNTYQYTIKLNADTLYMYSKEDKWLKFVKY